MFLIIELPDGKFKVKGAIDIGEIHLKGGSFVELPTRITFNDDILDLPEVYTVKQDVSTFSANI